MALVLPQRSGANLQSNLPATPGSGTTLATQVTAHATSHTKGSWTSLIDPVTFDVQGFWLYLGQTAGGATRTDLLVDIGIGPTGGGSEQVIVSNLIGGWRHSFAAGQGSNPYATYWPIFIPKGLRVSARAQALISADTVNVLIFLSGGMSSYWFPLCAGADDYGISTATSGGTSHTPGATGAESSYASIGSTLSKNYKGAIVIPQGTMTDTTMANQAYHWELAAGSNTLAEWYYVNTTGENICGPFPPFPVMTELPSGTQLQVRAESSGAAEAQDVGIYCLY